MKPFTSKLLALALPVAFLFGSAVQAANYGQSSDTSFVRVGSSNVYVPLFQECYYQLGVPGLTVLPLGHLDLLGSFQETRDCAYHFGGFTCNGVTVGGTPQYGYVAFAKVATSTDDDVWYGGWEQAPLQVPSVVYYDGQPASTAAPADGSIYNVQGINGYYQPCGSQLQGTLTVSGSSLIGSINYVMLGNNVTITDGSFFGPTADGGTIRGHFYGGNETTIAGIITFGMYGLNDMAFGGAQ